VEGGNKLGSSSSVLDPNTSPVIRYLSMIESATLMHRDGKANYEVKSTRNIHPCYKEEEQEDCICGLSLWGMARISHSTRRNVDWHAVW
jgi:hypothetical protein